MGGSAPSTWYWADELSRTPWTAQGPKVRTGPRWKIPAVKCHSKAAHKCFSSLLPVPWAGGRVNYNSSPLVWLVISCLTLSLCLALFSPPSFLFSCMVPYHGLFAGACVPFSPQTLPGPGFCHVPTTHVHMSLCYQQCHCTCCLELCSAVPLHCYTWFLGLCSHICWPSQVRRHGHLFIHWLNVPKLLNKYILWPSESKGSFPPFHIPVSHGKYHVFFF